MNRGHKKTEKDGSRSAPKNSGFLRKNSACALFCSPIEANKSNKFINNQQVKPAQFNIIYKGIITLDDNSSASSYAKVRRKTILNDHSQAKTSEKRFWTIKRYTKSSKKYFDAIECLGKFEKNNFEQLSDTQSSQKNDFRQSSDTQSSEKNNLKQLSVTEKLGKIIWGNCAPIDSSGKYFGTIESLGQAVKNCREQSSPTLESPKNQNSIIRLYELYHKIFYTNKTFTS